MNLDFLFFFNNLLIGVGLAADAFAVSLANGFGDPRMSLRRSLGIAGTFAVFQGLMPLFGWFLVHNFVEAFSEFEKFIPWIALALLGFIGGKMLAEGIRCKSHPDGGCDCDGDCKCENVGRVGLLTLVVQGVATSIDALSVGFTISSYLAVEAAVAALLIAAVTFLICFVGIYLGRRFGTALSGGSSILGGVILIAIGLEIFITSFFK